MGPSDQSQSAAQERDTVRDDVESQASFENDFEERESVLVTIREKNHQIQKLLDEMKELENENKDLDSKVNQLKHQLTDATHHVNQSVSDIKMLHNRMKEVQDINRQIISEKEVLLKENQELTAKIKQLQAEDDSMAKQFSAQIDKVINIMKEKDEEIDRLTETLKKYTKGIDKDGDSQEILLNDLKNQLKDATATISYQTSLIQQLQQQTMIQEEKRQRRPSEDIDPDNVLFQRLEQLEHELQEKDDKIVSLSLKIKSYEEGHYGLPDALREIDLIRDSMKRKDEQIIHLTKQLNNMSGELNDAQDELDYIKECANLSNLNIPDFNALDSAGRSKQDRLKLLRLQQQLIKLEDEKIDLEQEVRSLQNKLSQLKSSETNDALIKKVAELQLENSDLRLGMKEILIGIQESDGKSDVMIDCPTLERLNSFLESRTISSDLTTVLALKAELDVMRGFNTELRQQLKQVRIEHLKVLSLYTEDVLKETSFYHTEDDDDEEGGREGEDVDGEELSSIVSDTVTFSTGQVFPTGVRLASCPEPEGNESENEREAGETVRPSAPPYTEINIPQIVVQDAGSSEIDHRDVSCQTDAIQEIPKPATRSGWRAPSVSPTGQSVMSLTVKKCSRCSRLIKALNDVKTLLFKMETTVKHSEDACMERIRQLQLEHSSVVTSLQDQLRTLESAVKTKDSVIEVLKTAAAASITSSSSRQSQGRKTVSRRDTFVVSPDDVAAASSQIMLHTLPTEVALSLVQEEDSQADAIIGERQMRENGKEKYAEIIENVIKCLQGRIDSKNEAIKDFERLLEETKNTYEQEINLVMSQSKESQNELTQLMMKAVADNEELQSVLQNCMKELNDLKEEANKRISFLQNQVQEEREKVTQVQTENEDLKKRTSGHLTTIHLRNQVNQLETDLKSKESMIASLTKSLKEERLQRITSSKVMTTTISRDKTSVEGSLLDAQLKVLRQEVEDKKKQLKETELKKWENDKKSQEVIQSLKAQVSQQLKEIHRLKDYVDRQKHLLEQKGLSSPAAAQPSLLSRYSSQQQQTSQHEVIKDVQKVSYGKMKSVSFDISSPASSSPTVMNKKHHGVQVDLLTRRGSSSDVHDPEAASRLQEVKILLQESLQREKVAALRVSKSQCPEVTVDDILLQENAHLKVELRMAEFELNKRRIKAS